MTEKLATQGQLYEFLLRTTSDGVIVANHEGIIEQMNPAASAMLGITLEEVEGKTIRQAFGVNAALINLFIRSGEQTFDIRLPRRRLAVGIANTLEDASRMVILHDVTEQRELENRRESLIKAVVHDLRNPISAIGGFADLVDKFGDLNENQDKFVTRIRQTSSKLYEMLGTMVDLAWIEAGMPLEHRPIQMRDLINQAVDQLTHLAHERKIIIAISVQNPMPTVMGDPKRLQFVIYSLLHNAINYSDPEQTIAIHGWGDTHEVYCSVADRGIGIADDEIDLVFDRMFRSRDEVVRNTNGGGLGLTISKTIIERHGGDIWATSNLGEGSTFTFLLPVVQL